MSKSHYTSMVDSLIARRILSPAARDMAVGDLIHQLEAAGPDWAVLDLRLAWVQAGSPYKSEAAEFEARRQVGLPVIPADVTRNIMVADRVMFSLKHQSSSLVGSPRHGGPGPIVLILRDGELQTYVDDPERFGPKFGLQWCLNFWNNAEYSPTPDRATMEEGA